MTLCLNVYDVIWGKKSVMLETVYNKKTIQILDENAHYFISSSIRNPTACSHFEINMETDQDARLLSP